MRRHYVRGENLEARKSLFDNVADLIEHAQWQRTEQADMERVIDIRLPFPSCRPRFDPLGDIHSGLDEAEVQMGGRASERHPASVLFGPQGAYAGVGIGEVVDVEMSVGLDPARNHDLAAGVNRSSRLGRVLVGSDESNLFALDADAPLADTLRGNDFTAANQ